MIEKLENSLATIIDKSLVLAEKSGQFIIEEGGELLQQFFMWHTTKHVFWIGFALVIVLFYKTILKVVSVDTKEEIVHQNYASKVLFSRWIETESFQAAFYYILAIGLSIASISIFFTHLYKLVYILVAPKLYLIDYFVNLGQSC